jgi:hypothetical protein
MLEGTIINMCIFNSDFNEITPSKFLICCKIVLRSIVKAVVYTCCLQHDFVAFMLPRCTETSKLIVFSEISKSFH